MSFIEYDVTCYQSECNLFTARFPMKVPLLVSLIVLFACSSKPTKNPALVREEWKGHTTKELEDHPYFKSLPLNKRKHEENLETWIYRDQSHYQSSAYCQSLGGCMGMPFYNCDSAFSVKNGIILGFEQNGSCPPVSTIEVEKKSKE